MDIMDISEIDSLFNLVYKILKDGGVFTFATYHPCFTYPNNDYFTSVIQKGFAIETQPDYKTISIVATKISSILHYHMGLILMDFTSSALIMKNTNNHDS